MIWLISQMWALLFAAFFIGVATGWWMWGPRREKPVMRAADMDGSLAAEDQGAETKAAAE
jgi:cbb3-type cytochrome oxidase subunit 3